MSTNHVPYLNGLYDTIRQFAVEDADEICTWIKENIGKDATHSQVVLDKSRRQVDLAQEDVAVNVDCKFTVEDKTVEISWEYATKGDDIMVDATTKDVAAAVVEKLQTVESATSVKASTNVQASVPIRGADEDDVFNMDGADDFDPNFDPSAEGDGIVADEPQSDIEDESERPVDEFGNEIEEDDEALQSDNNIENHYVAECDRCHGIFISAMVETDQLVETVSGTCPLCGKKSDQYLKWIIRPVEKQIEDRSY